MKELIQRKNFFEKLFNKNHLPIILFIIVVINYMPLFINNINTTLSKAVTVKQMTIAFGIECIILFLYLIKNIKFTKKIIINLLVLFLTSIIMFCIQIKNYYLGNLQIMDLANIVCITINIGILYIAFLEIHIDEKNIYKFFAGIIIIGIIACIVNVIIYNKQFLNVLGIGTEAKVQSIKSFFAHRNQFAMFLYFSIISSIILFIKTNKKIIKVLLGIILILFGANLLLTASRTGILCTLAFIGLFFITTDTLKLKTKLIIILISLIILGIVLGIIYKSFPDIWEKIVNVISKVFIRESTIKTFTGRSKFWDLAFKVLFIGPISALFGIGRFVGIELLQSNGYNVTQFHSFYIEALVAGGVMELVYLISIYIIVMKNVLKSNIEKKYKLLYISLYLSYALYCGFESLGRFSIGCVDTMCLIFLITIPLLHSNTNKNEENNINKER